MKINNLFNQSQALCFKRWMGTNYAIFNTIKREVRIGILLTTYLSYIGFQGLYAQTDTTVINKKIKLNEIEVTARRAPSVYSEVGRIVTVLSRSQIESIPVSSVQELLRQVMSVDVRERGPLGIQADISIRGGSFDQVIVLLNGVNITDPQTGHHTLNLPVDLQSIERIEILYGPAARVYGPNAFSGAINIVTGTSDVNKSTIRTLAGEHGLYSTGVNTTINQGLLRNFISVNKGGSEGYKTNTDFDVLNLFYHGQLQLNNDKLSFQVGHTNKSFGANSFYTARFPNQFEETKTTFSSLSFNSGNKIRVISNVYWRRHHDRFELFRDFKDAETWYTGHNYHLTDVFGAGVSAVIPSGIGKTSVGGEVRGENVWSNVLGNTLGKSIKVPGEKGKYFTKGFSRSNASVFAEHNYTIKSFSVSAGVLLNQNSQLGYEVDVFPGVDLSFWITPNLKWIASYNSSLRLPTFTDLFYSGPTNIGNPNLKPEESSMVEMGLKFNNKLLSAHAVGFYREGRNLIDWGRIPGEPKYTTSNINSVNTYGLEFLVSMPLTTLLPGQNLIKDLNINYTYVHQDKKADEGYESVYVLDHLRSKLNIGLVHGIGLKNFTANWNFLYRDRIGFYTVSATNVQRSYNPFWITDFRLTWNKKRVKIFTEASNLLDEKYSDIGELIQPGRWVKGGVILDF